MNNNLYEVSKGPNNLKLHKILYYILSIAKFINVVLFILALIFAFSSDNVFYFSAIFFAISWVVTVLISHKFYNFYDYSFVEGNIRVVKVVNNKMRKLVANFDAKNIISYGLVFGETYEKNVKNKAIKKIYASPNVITENDIAILYSANGENNLICLPYDEGLLAVIMRYTGNWKLDKDFKEKLTENE